MQHTLATCMQHASIGKLHIIHVLAWKIQLQLPKQVKADKITACSTINHKFKLLATHNTFNTQQTTFIHHMALAHWWEATQNQFFEGGGGKGLVPLLLPFFTCAGAPFSFQQSRLKWPGLPQWWHTFLASTAPNTIGELPLYLELEYCETVLKFSLLGGC